MPGPLLKLHISADYPGRPDVLRNLRLEVHPGEIVGLVGRSGEGKSTVTLSILGLLGHKGGRCRGEILFQGRDLAQLTQNEMRQLRGNSLGLVPQSPLAALNPALRLGTQLREAWRAHKKGQPDAERLMQAVSLPSDEGFLRQYPHNLSVGMAQRFVIAMAIQHAPPLLLADEPTSALDMITQAGILRLFRQLNQERGTAMLYISHDLLSVASLCHRVAILERGEIVECGPVSEIFSRPRHAYTKELLAAIPRVRIETAPQDSALSENTPEQTTDSTLALAKALEPDLADHSRKELV